MHPEIAMQRRRSITLAGGLLLAAPLAQAQWPSEDGDYRIQRALYGTADRYIDVTEKLREIARSDQRVRLTNELFGSDPARGVVKQLRIYARGPGGRSRVFEYTEGSLIDGAQFAGWGRGDWGQGGGDRGEGGWGGRPGYQDDGDGEYRILQARYGTLQRSVDVTERLRELAKADRRFRLGNDSFGVDPARGEVKALRISARRRNEAVRVFEYLEGSWVDGAQFSGWSGGAWGPQRPRLEILRASYGAGRQRSDVTARLQSLLADGRLTLRVDNNTMGGDPARGEVKRLSLRYRLNGQDQRIELAEGEQLSLP
jgi:hypothetical protein